MIHFSQLEKITGGRILSFSKEQSVSSLITDSRKPRLDDGSIFFAMKGEHHDGHEYISKLYAEGVRQFIVEKSISLQHIPDSNVLQVSSGVEALQRIASFHRKQFSVPVVGITGSNGKTIVKEWLYQLLSPDLTVAKNPGSYNSQIGVPLSVWQLREQHQLGIFEAGISRTGEMENLARVIDPSIGIFTNIGTAHNEGFTSLREKIDEKLNLFRDVELLIYCVDHKALDEAIRAAGIRSLRWGFSKEADIQISGNGNHFKVRWQKMSFSIDLPFKDPASVENCFHCVALMIHLGYDPSVIMQRVGGLSSVPMRLELKEGINNCQIIDDSYNNDLGGLRISIEFLSNQHQKTKRSLILSDIFESGLEPKALASQVAELLREKNISRFIGIGSVLSSHRNLFPAGSTFFDNAQDFLDRFNVDEFSNEIILVKGARVFQFEKIISRLQRKVHGTVMEIDLGAIVHNLNLFRSKLNPGTKLMVMVKAFAYGSGSTEIANILQYHQVSYLGVAYADEGVELRKNNISLPVMVMNPSEESFSQILANNLEPEVYSFKILHSLLHFLAGKKCPIHIKLDTGMHRLGFEQSDVKDLIALLKANSNVTVATIFTHLAGADEHEHDQFSRQQANDFKHWADLISDALGYRPIYHVLNSPGILRLPELQMDMVRLGIGLYGVDPTPYNFDALKPVATLKTLISQIKNIEPGETIGYGRKGKASTQMKLATIAIGYADGFSRAFSQGKGEVLVRGKRAKVVGNVCMDMTMVDITGIDAKEGDEVIIFGTGLPIQQVASSIHTIPYEILTNTSERVKRVFVAESI